MGTKLYVGGLPYSTTEQQLQELFSQQGSVTSAKIITDRYTGQSRGFGFVEMATAEEAQIAEGALIAEGEDAGRKLFRLADDEARQGRVAHSDPAHFFEKTGFKG